MQNRYTGDIGDFSKLGLLRALRTAGFSIGLNWYLTPDETHNDDGRHVAYLNQDEYRACDEELWLALGKIVASKRREIRFLESESILQATFFSDCLDFSDLDRCERSDLRTEWFTDSLGVMAANDIVCVDPDNGLVVPSAKGGPKENKYVLPEEIDSYYAQGSTVIYYQHKARQKDPFYTDQLEQLLKREGLAGAAGMALKFEKVSQRYYMFVIQPRHRDLIERTVDEMLSGEWGKHFRLLWH